LTIANAISSGPTLVVGANSDLVITGTATAGTAITLDSATKMLEVGATGTLTITPAETIAGGIA